MGESKAKGGRSAISGTSLATSSTISRASSAPEYGLRGHHGAEEQGVADRVKKEIAEIRQMVSVAPRADRFTGAGGQGQNAAAAPSPMRLSSSAGRREFHRYRRLREILPHAFARFWSVARFSRRHALPALGGDPTVLPPAACWAKRRPAAARNSATRPMAGGRGDLVALGNMAFSSP
jgi:hypothetical protein